MEFDVLFEMILFLVQGEPFSWKIFSIPLISDQLHHKEAINNSNQNAVKCTIFIGIKQTTPSTGPTPAIPSFVMRSIIQANKLQDFLLQNIFTDFIFKLLFFVGWLVRAFVGSFCLSEAYFLTFIKFQFLFLTFSKCETFKAAWPKSQLVGWKARSAI